MQLKSCLAIAASVATLSGCGDTLPEQALIGAGAGAGAAAVVDGSLATGALVGAAGNVAYCQSNPGRC
ncbi:hypothetical protein [Roseovarius aestuariivivens]|uniref:hypothetical protein n=1 Tax=Roseovarius aestuariivivens TaxID=1888910 RepID=UPI0010808F6E|nr:hypothetical protein [Roseovarius aestuariivivens]